jgi:hypothetical protein
MLNVKRPFLQLYHTLWDYLCHCIQVVKKAWDNQRYDYFWPANSRYDDSLPLFLGNKITIDNPWTLWDVYRSSLNPRGVIGSPLNPLGCLQIVPEPDRSYWWPLNPLGCLQVIPEPERSYRWSLNPLQCLHRSSLNPKRVIGGPLTLCDCL